MVGAEGYSCPGVAVEIGLDGRGTGWLSEFLFPQMALGTDPVRGDYIDNIDIGRLVKASLQ